MRKFSLLLFVLLSFFMLSAVRPADAGFTDEVLALINAERVKAGVHPLTSSLTLTQAAIIRSKELTQSFSHTRPDGSSSLTVSPHVVGENIAGGYDTPEQLVSAWMSSQGHKANILRDAFYRSGLAAYKHSDGIIYVSHLFGLDNVPDEPHSGDGLGNDLDDAPTYKLTVALSTGGSVANSDGEYEENEQISLEATPSSGYRFVSWTSSGGGSFSDAGNVATTFTMPAADVTVTANFALVLAPPTKTKVAVSPQAVNLAVGRTHQFRANVTGESLTDLTVSWHSSDESVAGVDSDGLVTARKAGMAIITAVSNADNGSQDNATVIVTADVTIGDILQETSGGTGISVETPIIPQTMIDAVAGQVTIEGGAPKAVVEYDDSVTVEKRETLSGMSADSEVLAPSLSIKVPVSLGNLLPLTYTLSAESASSIADGWSGMSHGERLDQLARRVKFCYEYDGGARAPDVLVGSDGVTPWPEAISFGIASIGSDGSVTVNYTVVNGSGDPLAIYDTSLTDGTAKIMVVFDNDGDPECLSDPAWFVIDRSNERDESSGSSSGCVAGSGVMVLCAAFAALRKRDAGKGRLSE